MTLQRPELPHQVWTALERLSRFWTWRRRPLAQQISAHLQAFAQDAQQLHEVSLVQYEQLKQQDQHLKAQLEQITRTAEHAQACEQRAETLREQCQQTQADLEHAREAVSRLHAQSVSAAQRIGALDTHVAVLENDLKAKEQSIAVLQEANEQWATSQAGLHQNLEQITHQHLTLKEKFDLISQVLALAPAASTALVRFHQLIDEDYQRFVAQESSLPDDAGALLALQAIARELRLIVDFPPVHGKTLVAVAGGYSSGKSRFINSFIKDTQVTLAVGMNPVTVVPSYVICAEQPQIRGYARNGGSLPLAPQLYASLSHEYLESFGFDLRRIMPYISVQAPMDWSLFEHLCLIDTPGYNPGNSQTQGADYRVAQQLVGRASAMIWLVGLQNNGTLSSSDLAFIEQSGLYGQSLYVVLNQCDLKSESSNDAILEQVQFTLDSHGIEVAGLCTYSSRTCRMYKHAGQTLDEFLRQHNRRDDVIGRLQARVDEVFDRYQRAISADLERCKDGRQRLKDFRIRILAAGGSALHDACDKLCEGVEREYEGSDLRAHAEQCEDLRKRFKAAITETLEPVLSAAR